MKEVLVILAAGFCGSMAMLGFVSVIHKLKFAHADPVHALGSLFTGKAEKQLYPGFFLYMAGGCLLAFVMFILMDLVNPGNMYFSALMGAILGFGIGWVPTLGSVYFIAKRHPLEEFRQLPLPGMMTYVFGHAAFGLLVGIVYGLSGICTGYLRECIVR